MLGFVFLYVMYWSTWVKFDVSANEERLNVCCASSWWSYVVGNLECWSVCSLGATCLTSVTFWTYGMSLWAWLAALLKAADIFARFCMWLAPSRIETPVREQYFLCLASLISSCSICCFLFRQHLPRSLNFLPVWTSRTLVAQTLYDGSLNYLFV